MGSLDLVPGFFEPRVARRTSVWCVDRASIIRDSRIGLLCNTDEDTCKFRDLKEPETERKIRALSIWNKYTLEPDFQDFSTRPLALPRNFAGREGRGLASEQRLMGRPRIGGENQSSSSIDFGVQNESYPVRCLAADNNMKEIDVVSKRSPVRDGSG
jgi:hypothetical protein